MGKLILFHNATVYARDSLFRGWLSVEGGRIARMGCDAPPPLDAERLDLGGRILAPGLIDLHVHGALARDTMDAAPEGLRAMAVFFRTTWRDRLPGHDHDGAL